MQFPLACPIDGLALDAENSFRCPSAHTYDLSKDGYINLLPVQFKPSADPGDSRSMVSARRSVMQSGLFEPVSCRVCDLVEGALLTIADGALIVDAGCGEGYYTHQIQKRLTTQCSSGSSSSAQFGPGSILGVDISKWAIRAAARQYRDLSWAVANNKRLPIVRGSVGLITSLFGFECWNEWATQQTKDQQVLVVSAGPTHLLEIRELIYETVAIHDSPLFPEARLAGYSQIHHESFTCQRPITEPSLLTKVVAMTPHAHRVNSDSIRRLGDSELRTLTLDVVIRIFQRSN